MTLLDLFLLLCVVSIFDVSLCGHKYKIVQLDEEFSGFSSSTKWFSRVYGTSKQQAMLPYGPIRIDSLTSLWNLDNSTEVNLHLKSVFYNESIRCPVFKSEVFLSLLCNKKMTIIGDSIAQQMFEGLYNSLMKYATLYSNESHHSTTILSAFTDRGYQSLSIIYGGYNASVHFCFNPYLRSNTRNQCTRTYYSDADVVVLGTGTWYKPLMTEEHQRANLTYAKSHARSVAELRHDVTRERLFLSQTLPRAKVLWLLLPQMGNIDELYFVDHSTAISHLNASWWSDINHSAAWVTEYNDILTKKAEEFGDLVLDRYTLSTQYIDYFSRMRGIPVHADTYHYVGDGLPRGGTILLQDALYDLQQINTQ